MFSFSLARGWDVVAARRHRRERERGVLLAVADEIDANREVARNNQELVKTELELLRQGKHLVNPLDPLGDGFWDLVRLEPPAALVEGKGLSHARRVARLTAQVNEIIGSRERFRAANQALSGLDQRLEKYDQLIQKFEGELIEAIDQLKPALTPPARRSALRLVRD